MDKVNQERLKYLKKIISEKDMIISNILQESKYFKSENENANRDIFKLNSVYQTHVLDLKKSAHIQDNEIKILKDHLERAGLLKTGTKKKTKNVTEQNAQEVSTEETAREGAGEKTRRTAEQGVTMEGANLEVAQEGVGQEVAQEGTRQEEGTSQEGTQEGTGEREAGGDSEELEVQVDTESEFQETMQRGSQFKCNICGYTRRTKKQLEKHMTSRHDTEEDSSFCCGECSFQTNNKHTLIQHLEKSHSKHICNNCNMFLDSKNKLNQHIQEKHKSHKPCRDYATNSCEYEEECKFKHIKLQDNKQICYKCGTITATVKDLMKHIQEIHGSQPCTKFAAGQCDRNTRCWYSHGSLPNNPISQNTSNVEEQDFQDPPTIRGLYSQVVGAGRQQQVHQVSQETQHQKIFQTTHAILEQLLPSLVKQIIESLNNDQN